MCSTMVSEMRLHDKEINMSTSWSDLETAHPVLLCRMLKHRLSNMSTEEVSVHRKNLDTLRLILSNTCRDSTPLLDWDNLTDQEMKEKLLTRRDSENTT